MGSGVRRRNRVLDRRAYWHHLANTAERLIAAAMSLSADRGGDVAYSRITLGNLVCTTVAQPAQITHDKSAGLYQFYKRCDKVAVFGRMQ